MLRPDIQTVAGDYVQGSFTFLPHAGERARAALFFLRQIDLQAREGKEDIARWNFRAAMSEFRSIFDLLPVDLRTEGLDKPWGRSTFKSEIDSFPLIVILIKIRNFAVHTAHVRGISKDSRSPVQVIRQVSQFKRRHGRNRGQIAHFLRFSGTG